MANVENGAVGNANAVNGIAIVGGFLGVFGIWATGWPVVVCALISAFIIGALSVLAIIQSQQQLDDLTDWIERGGLGWGYRRLIGRTLARNWHRFCRPAPASAPWWRSIQAAFSWRLYDLALFVAVAYPILAMILIWLITGQPSGFDDDPFLHALEVGSALHVVAVVLTALWLAAIFLNLRENRGLATNEGLSLGEMIGFPLLIGCATLIWFDYFTVAIRELLQGAATILGLVLSIKAFRVQFSLSRVGGSLVLGGCLFSLFILASRTGTFDIGGGLVYRFAMVATVLVSLAVLVYLAGRGRRWVSPVVVTLAVPILAVAAAMLFTWKGINDREVAIFLFFMVLPLLNAVFDVVSYAITIALVRLGLRARKVPGAVFGLIDLGVAALLFFVLGLTIVLVVAGLNGVASAPILDLARMLDLVAEGPSGQTAWVYVMVCSTLLPTVVHFSLALLSVERAIVPLAAPFANRLRNARNSTGHVVIASFSGGALLMIPVGILWMFGWAAWWFLGDVLSAYGTAYMSLLRSVAESIGAL